MSLKSIFILLLALLPAGYAAAQDEGTAESKPAKSSSLTSVTYTVGELEKLNKLELSQIYITKLTRLYNIIPYLPFQKLEPKNADDLKIPANSVNEKALKSVRDTVTEFNKNLDENLTNIIPYADKGNLINAILFLQSVISKLELAGSGVNMTNSGF